MSEGFSIRPAERPSDNTLLRLQHWVDHLPMPGNGNLGNVGYNSLRGPRGFYSDLSVTKDFPDHGARQTSVPHGRL